MAKGYAIRKKDTTEVLYHSENFDMLDVTQKIELSDDMILLISGKDHYQETIEDLNQKLEEAESANIAKEAFLSNMSHDIRTPMNAIVGMTALAKKYIDEKARVTDALNKIDAASVHLLSLINDILDMSRINSGKLEITPELFSLPVLIHDTVSLIRPQLEKRGHRFELLADELETESFYGDTLRIRQILVNILSNAVKYTPDGGEISLSVKELDGEEDIKTVVFICKDNGMGMSRDFVERIFEPFERVNNSTISGIEGTGLGMSIVKKLVDAMHGHIEIDSELSKGTAISISLPLKVSEETVDSQSLKGKEVLVIEANEKQASRFEDILSSEGIGCSIVSSAADAISAMTEASYRDASYSVIVIGEEMNGEGNIFELASYLSKSDPDICLVLSSSADWDAIEYQAQKNGITAFIPVPFYRKSLINGLAAALSKNTGSSSSESIFPDLKGKRILLVEDNMINREIAKEMLSSTGAEITIAENGKEAVDAFASSSPGFFSIILMDIQMPVMDGYTATKNIRDSGREDADLPIFAMTANTFAEDIAKAKASGMNGHVAKPIDVSILMQTLRRALL